MHIFLALITALGSLFWALNRFGVDMDSINPFLWHRRRRWRKQLQTKPLHNLKRPIEAASVLIVGIAQAEGAVSKEQKSEIIRIFKEEFKLDPNAAHDYFGAAVFMLKDVMNVAAEVPNILDPCKEKFTAEQSSSLLDILRRVSALEGAPMQLQEDVIRTVEKILITDEPKPGDW